MIEMLLPVIGIVIGIVVGWVLGEISFWFRWRREWRRKLKELRIETYAEWAAGMEENLQRYATQTGGEQSEYKTPLCEKRLQLIEDDTVALGLIQQISDSIPALHTNEYHELRMQAKSCPEWDWPPFHEKMDELLDHVRRRICERRVSQENR